MPRHSTLRHATDFDWSVSVESARTKSPELRARRGRFKRTLNGALPASGHEGSGIRRVGRSFKDRLRGLAIDEGTTDIGFDYSVRDSPNSRR